MEPDAVYLTLVSAVAMTLITVELLSTAPLDPDESSVREKPSFF